VGKPRPKTPESLELPEIFCPLRSSLAVERAQNSAKKKSSKLLERYDVTDDDCLHSIVTGNEICGHRLDPETQRNSIEWHQRTSSKMRKPKTMPSTYKTTATASGMIKNATLVKHDKYSLQKDEWVKSSPPGLLTIPKRRRRGRRFLQNLEANCDGGF